METETDLENYYDFLSHVFSRSADIYDEKIRTNFVNVNIRKMEISYLLKYSKPKIKVLEVGQGTGEEACIYMKSTGNAVRAIDISQGMVSYSTKKADRLGLGSMFNASVLPAHSIGSVGGQFDLIYSLNGLVNTEPKLNQFISGIAEITHPGSVVIISFRNTRCLGEMVLQKLLGARFTGRSRKLSSIPVEVVGIPVPSRYYSAREMKTNLQPHFTVRKIAGLAVILPPYLASKISSPIIQRFIICMENLLGRMPVFRNLGDEVLLVAVRK